MRQSEQKLSEDSSVTNEIRKRGSSEWKKRENDILLPMTIMILLHGKRADQHIFGQAKKEFYCLEISSKRRRFFDFEIVEYRFL
ncbi:GTP-dependent dephospho-CoA kinase [Dirofilaria immitis]